MGLRTVVLFVVLLIFISGNIHEGLTVTGLIVFILGTILYAFLFIYLPYSSRRKFINHTIKNLSIKNGIVSIETCRWLINKPKFYSFSFDDITIGESEYPYLNNQIVIAINAATINPQSLYMVREFFTNIKLFEDTITDKIDDYLKKRGFEKTVAGIDIKETNAGEISMGGPWASKLYIENHIENDFVIEDVVTDNYLFDKKARRFYFVRAHFIEGWYFKIGYYTIKDYHAYEFNRQFKAVYLKELVGTNKIGISFTMQPEHEGYDELFDTEQEAVNLINS